MRKSNNYIKYFFSFALYLVGMWIVPSNVYGQKQKCDYKKVKRYQYYNTITEKVIGERERIYLNDSVFYEVSLYNDSNFNKRVIGDTFKIVNSGWYYKLGNEFKIFFNIDSFKAKIPTIKKAYEFDGKFYGYGACTSYTPVEKVNSHGEVIFKFYVSDGDCNGGIPNRRDYNPIYYYFDTDIGFITIKDRFDEYRMKVLEYY